MVRIKIKVRGTRCNSTTQAPLSPEHCDTMSLPYPLRYPGRIHWWDDAEVMIEMVQGERKMVQGDDGKWFSGAVVEMVWVLMETETVWVLMKMVVEIV